METPELHLHVSSLKQTANKVSVSMKIYHHWPGHSSGVTHTLFTLSITWPGGHVHPWIQTAGQIFGPESSQVEGHAEAQVLKICPSISHTGWHTGQHSPGGTTHFSPAWQMGNKQETAEQSGVVGTHSGQHSPSGVTSFSPAWQTGNKQETAEQSGVVGTHSGQHSPSDVTSSSPPWQSGFAQPIWEQSVTHMGQHWPSGTAVFCPDSQSGSRQRTVAQLIDGIWLGTAVNYEAKKFITFHFRLRLLNHTNTNSWSS